MLQTSHLAQTPSRAATAIQRAFIRLDAIHAEWVALANGGNEKRFDQLCGQGQKLASKIIQMPAQRPGDVLLKIAAVGVLMDRASDRAPLATWQFKPSGFQCDDAGGTLLMSLRDDLNRILEGI